MDTSDNSDGQNGRRYADTKSTAHYIGVSAAFLEKARTTGTPAIPFIKIGRVVRYDLARVDEAMASLRRHSTSEAA